MEDLTGKIDGAPAPDGKLPAIEWNQLPDEVQRVILDAGIVLSNGDLTQLAKAISSYVAAGNYYTGSGGPIAYIAALHSGLRSPAGYFPSMTVRFKCPITSTTTTPTVNVAGLGIKNIVNYQGGPLLAGDLDVDREIHLTYDGTDFRLAQYSKAVLTSNTFPNRYRWGGHSRTNWEAALAADQQHQVRVFAGDARSFNGHDITWNIELVKSIDNPWASGSGAGGFPTTGLTLTDDTWYALYMINKANGTFDFGFDLYSVGHLPTNLLNHANTVDSGWVSGRIMCPLYYKNITIGIHNYFVSPANPYRVNYYNPATAQFASRLLVNGQLADVSDRVPPSQTGIFNLMVEEDAGNGDSYYKIYNPDYGTQPPGVSILTNHGEEAVGENNLNAHCEMQVSTTGMIGCVSNNDVAQDVDAIIGTHGFEFTEYFV